MPAYTSEQLLEDIQERISYSNNGNIERSLDLALDVLNLLHPDTEFSDHQAKALNAFLEAYAQVIAAETVQITLGALTEMGTIGHLDS